VALKSDFEWLPTEMEGVGGGVVFTVPDADHGYELWSTDGTSQGTRLAQDIVPGPDSSYPQDIVRVGSRVVFLADETATGREPWGARTAILLGSFDQAVRDLRGDVAALGLSDGLTTSLLVKLDSVAKALERGRRSEALHGLEVFSRHLETLTPKWISPETAADLRDFATEIGGLLTP
jgi:ELWxxDGT repeat protein